MEGTGCDPPSGQDKPFAANIRTGRSLLPPSTSIDGKRFGSPPGEAR